MVIPVLLHGLGPVLGYSFLHWLLVLQTDWLIIDPLWSKFILPLAVGIGWMLVALRRRWQWRDWPLRHRGEALVVTLFFCAPVLCAQLYLSMAAGPALQVASPREIDPAVHARFYRIDRAELDPSITRRFFVSRIGGSRPRQFQMTATLLCPLRDPADKNTVASPGIWYLESFSQSLPVHENDDARRQARAELLARGGEEFSRRTAANIQFYERVEPGSTLRQARSAIDIEGQPGAMANVSFLRGHFEPWSERGSPFLALTLGFFSGGALAWITLGVAARRRTSDAEILARQAASAHRNPFLTLFGKSKSPRA